MKQRNSRNRKILLWTIVGMFALLMASLTACNCEPPPVPGDGVCTGSNCIDGGINPDSLPPTDTNIKPETPVDQFPPPPPDVSCIQRGQPCVNDQQCNPSCTGNTYVCFEGNCLPQTPPPPDVMPPTETICPSRCASHDDCSSPSCGNRTQCVNGACSFIPPTCPRRCRADSDCATPDCGKRVQCVQQSCTAPPECPGACFQDSDCNVVTCGPRKSCENGACVEPRQNTAPVANAGPDTKTSVGARVVLNGSGSSDADGDKLTFSWRFVSKPNGSLTQLDDVTSPTPAFVPDKEGNYTLELIVNDGRESSKPDTVLIAAGKNTTTAPQITSFGPSNFEEGYPPNSPLAVFGQNFVNGARVNFNGTFVATSFLNSNAVTITVPGGLTARNVVVYLQNPDGQLSNKATFVIKKKAAQPPVLTQITPVETDAGTTFSLSAYGRNFVSGAVILINGKAANTGFVSSTRVVSNQVGGLAAGTYQISVRNPDGQTTGVATLQVKTVKQGPVINSVAPTSVFAGQTVTLTLKGLRFTASTVAFVAGKSYMITFKSASEITISGVAFPTTGQIPVYVENTGGLKSNQVLVEVKKALPAPTISSLNPNPAVEKTAVSLGVFGTGFVQGTKVTVAGQAYTTTYVSATEMRVNLPNTLAVGSYPVQATNPDGKQSNTFNLSVKTAPPKPVLTSITPTRIPLASSTVITATGSNFVKGAQVQVGTRLLVTTFVSATSLTFSLPSNFQVGKYNVRVFNPDGQSSGTVSLEVYKGPPPVLTSLSPNSATAGSVQTIRLIGSNFANGATAIFQGGKQPTTFGSATELQMTLSLSSLAPGTYEIWVQNPDQQVSGKLKFTVNPPKGPQIKQVLPNNGQTNTKVNGIVDGAAFQNGATVQMGSKTFKATFLSTSTLGVTFDLTGVAAGTYAVTVTNPDGNKSNIVYFTVTANQLPAPILTTVNPASIKLGSNSAVYLLGKNFQNGALMMIQLPFVGSIGMPTNFINSTTLVVTAQFPRIPFPFPAQNTQVFVRNPGTTNRDSNRKSITIRP